MKDIQKMIRFYRKLGLLDDLAIDYRIKSIDFCLGKYDKFYRDMRVKKNI